MLSPGLAPAAVGPTLPEPGSRLKGEVKDRLLRTREEAACGEFTTGLPPGKPTRPVEPEQSGANTT